MTLTSETPTTTSYYGKHRGTVLNNIDPLMRGRLLLEVPDVVGLSPSSWAEACVPLSGPPGVPMGSYFVPPVGAGVWVEFEGGDPSHPIWTGCRFDTTADVPPAALMGVPSSPSSVLQTAGQTGIIISDMPGPLGGIMMRAGTAVFIMNAAGISLSNGQGASLLMTGPTTDINSSALTVI